MAPGATTHFAVSLPTTGTAGATNGVTVTALDANGNVATGYTGTVHFTASDQNAVLPADMTLTNGVGGFQETPKTAGTETATATDTAAPGITGTSNGEAVAPGAATHFAVSLPANGTAGTANGVTVTALDANGNVATGYTGTVHFTASDQNAVLPADMTLTNGVGSFQETPETAGNETVTATDTTTSSVTGTSNTEAVAPGPATHFVVSLPASGTAETQNAFTVTAEDAEGNVATGYTGTVQFSSSDPNAVLPGPATLTNGVGTFNETPETAGNETITAADTTTSSITGTSNTEVVAPGPATEFVVTLPATGTAGTQNAFTVTAEDAEGNVATGYTGTVQFSSSDPNAVLPGPATLTNGVGTFNEKPETAGNETVTATDTTTSSITGTSSTEVVAPGPATHFVVSLPASGTAGTQNAFTVTAEDAEGNVATGYAGTVHFTSNDPNAVLPADATLTNGSGTFSETPKTPNEQETVTATDTTSSITGTSNSESVAAVAPTIMGTTGGQTTTSETPDTTLFSGVTVADPNANGAPDTLTITLSGGNGGTLSEGNGFGGTPTLTPTEPDTYTLSGTAEGITAELDTLVFTPNAGQANSSATTTFALSDASSAGTTSATDFTTTVTDIDPAVAPTITGTTGGQITTSEAPDTTVFSGVTVTDPNANGIPASKTPAATRFPALKVAANPNGAQDTLTITLSGGNGGTLSEGNGFGGIPTLTPTGASNSYTLNGTADAITAELDNLVFTPSAGQANTRSTTTFGLSDASSAGTTSATDFTTTVTDIDPAVAPTITGTTGGQTTTSEAPDTTVFSGVTVTDPNANGIPALTTPALTLFSSFAAAGPNPNGAQDTLTITLSGGNGGTLSEGTGFGGTQTLTPTGASNSYTLSGTADAITAELDNLDFTPNAGQANTSSTTTFGLSDASSAGTTSATDSTTTVTDIDPAVAPSITGTVAGQGTTSEQPINLFSGVSITDPNANATDAVTIQLSGNGTGGTLSGAGLGGGQNGTYSLAAGTAANVTAALDQLVFTPKAGSPNTQAITSFTLTDQTILHNGDNTTAGPTASDAKTSVIDTDPTVAPTISGTHATATSAEAVVTPFSGVTLADANSGATDSLAIALSGGGGGTLSGSGLTQTGATSYTLATGTAAEVTALLDGLSFTPAAGAPGAQSTTSFALSDASSAGTGASDSNTGVVDTAAPAVIPPPVIIPPPVVIPPPTNNQLGDTTPPLVAFSPAVSFSSPTTVTFTGTVADNVGVASVELFEGATDLGPATLNGDGTWSFTTSLARGFHTGLSAVATDTSGNSASAPSDFDLTTGVKSPIPGQPYTAVQDRYDTAGNFLGQTFFQRRGAVLFSSSFAALPDGGLSYTYSGGSFFDDKPYSSFTDNYSAPDTPAAVEILDNTDGSHTITAEEGGVTLHSIGSDTMIGAGSSDRFVFSRGFGQDTITGFQAGGPGHDTLVLPSADASRLAHILASAHTANGDTTLHIDRQDSITLQGVTLAELKNHPNDFKFHA